MAVTVAAQTSNSWGDNLFELLAEESLLLNPRLLTPREVRDAWSGSPDITFGFTGQQTIAGRDVTLLIGLQSTPGLKLPKVKISPWDALGFMPHVDVTGNVCFLNLEGLVLDRSRPNDLIADSLALTKSVLEDGCSGRNRRDFMDEFNAYWLQASDPQMVPAFVSPTDQVKKLVIAEEDRKIVHIADDEKAVRSYLSGQKPKHHTLRSALYVPLEAGTVIVPPRPGAMWKAKEIRRLIFDNTSAATKKAIRKLIKNRGNEAVVVIKLPRPSGGESLIGIHFYGVGKYHPLRSKGDAAKITPLIINRFDEAYVVPRGGAKRNLKGKKVLLIGCGSIGGFLAHLLVQTGVSQLTLVDPERLTQENIFRHQLGGQYIGKPKSESLKNELTANLPYLNLKSHVKSIEDALYDGSVAFEDYDLIITALGIPTLELHLNEMVRRQPGSPPTIISWLEPFGIGGHAMLTNIKHEPTADSPGCFECPFTSATDQPPLFNRASFAASGQDFAKNIAGCGSLFTPFGSLDAVRTAEHATRLAIKVLTGKVLDNPVSSWKGDPQDFLDAGYELAPRFSLSEQELYEQRLAYINARCPVCSKKVS